MTSLTLLKVENIELYFVWFLCIKARASWRNSHNTVDIDLAGSTNKQRWFTTAASLFTILSLKNLKATSFGVQQKKLNRASSIEMVIDRQPNFFSLSFSFGIIWTFFIDSHSATIIQILDFNEIIDLILVLQNNTTMCKGISLEHFPTKLFPSQKKLIF